MNRRTVLRAGAAALGGGTATLAGVTLASESASGQADLSLSVTGDEVQLAPDESITTVQLAVDVDWQVTLPSGVTPDTRTLTLAAGVGEPVVVASDAAPLIRHDADGSVTLAADLLASDAVAAAALRESPTELTVRAALDVTSMTGEAIAEARASTTATLTVTETVAASEFGAVGGDGEVTIETG